MKDYDYYYIRLRIGFFNILFGMELYDKFPLFWFEYKILTITYWIVNNNNVVRLLNSRYFARPTIKVQGNLGKLGSSSGNCTVALSKPLLHVY